MGSSWKYRTWEHDVAPLGQQGQEFADYWRPAAERSGRVAGYSAMQAGQGITGFGQQQEEVRRQQQQFTEALRRRAAGEVPSAAEQQMKLGAELARRQAMSQAAGMRGVAPGMARYLAGQQAAQAQQGIFGQTAALRAQEQAQAEQALGQALSGVRTQDIGLRAQDIGREQAFNQLQQQYMQMGMSADQAALAAQNAEEQLRLGAYQAYNQARAQSYDPGFGRQLAGGLMQAGGAFLGGLGMKASDERLKTGIKKLKPDTMKRFAKALQGYSYRYKSGNPSPTVSPSDEHGTRFGPMAQALLKSEVGRSMVKKMPGRDGKDYLHIDMNQATFATMAGLGYLDERLSKIEGMKKFGEALQRKVAAEG